MSSPKKLYRSRSNRKIAGVCGGLGEYFEIDPTLIRLAVVFFSLWWGGGLIAYFIAWFVIPEEPVAETKRLPDLENGRSEPTHNQPG
jgi:phage shock protein PspC (stress-responsive transcriptional regulator)